MTLPTLTLQGASNLADIPAWPDLGMPISTTWPVDYTEATYTPGHGIIALRFDDGHHDEIDYVAPMLAERGLVGGFAVPAWSVSGAFVPEYLNPAQLLKIESLGNEIICHSWHHGNEPTTFAEFYDETVGAKALLMAMGLTIQYFVQSPYWQTTYLVDPATGWTMGSDADLLLRANFAAYQGQGGFVPDWRTMPILPEYRYGTSHASPTTAALTTDFIDQVITMSSGGTSEFIELLFHSHTIEAGMGWTDFGTVLDYLETKVAAGVLDVLTPTQALYAVPS